MNGGINIYEPVINNLGYPGSEGVLTAILYRNLRDYWDIGHESWTYPLAIKHGLLENPIILVRGFSQLEIP